jgi:carbonic anhydrase/acetyltransferase-like protein (isoleucine patch superfamily)
MTEGPFVLPYHDVFPTISSLRNAGDRSAVIGRVTIGSGAWLGALALIRGDGHFVRIGTDFYLGDRGTVHIAHEIYPAIVGERVTVGCNGVVHACTVGNDCVIEPDAVILDGSVAEDGVVLEAGAVALPSSHLNTGTVYAGIPAKPVRKVEEGEIARRAARIRSTPTAAVTRSQTPTWLDIHPTTFIAGNTTVAGKFRAQAHASVLFSCELDAGEAEIVVGKNSNIQDNTVIRCTSGPFTMGSNSVIGHNVRLESCLIGDCSLVGIGSTVAAGTVIEDGAVLAAGATTSSHQRLESGWLWAGRPAQRIALLDDGKRDLIRWIISTYCEYTANFLRSQRELKQITREQKVVGTG